MNKSWDDRRPKVIASALLLSCIIMGCARTALQDTPPHIVASLSDHRYFWFLYRDDQEPQLRIWRVNTGSPTFERFCAPIPSEDCFRDWQIDGGWIWYLTDTGLWRVGRFPPDTGKCEEFEPDLINAETIGDHKVVLVENARIIIGGENGLFLFDRQGRDLVRISGQQAVKLRKSPFGMLVFTDRAFFLLDTALADPAMKKLSLKACKSWQEVPPTAYVTADPERHAIVAMVDRSTLLFLELESLNVELDPREYLREACNYGGQLWLLTSKPRLIVMKPDTDEAYQYNLYHIPGVMSQFTVQDGRLRCGTIVAEERRKEPLVGAVRFWPGDIKPVIPIKGSLPVTDVNFLRERPIIQKDETDTTLEDAESAHEIKPETAPDDREATVEKKEESAEETTLEKKQGKH